MSQQSRPAWARLPFMARASQNPAPAAPTAPPTAPPPAQPPQPRGPFRQLGRTQSVLSQPQEPTPPPSPAATPPSPPPAPARSSQRSPVKPPAPAPSTPRKSPISAPPTVSPSPKPSAPLPPRETTSSSTSKSPIINTLSNSPVPKEPLTNVRVPSSPIRDSPKSKSQAPSSSMPASTPVPKPVATAAQESSPKTVKPLEKTPVQSPKPKPVARPPSPFALPPSQLKSDSEREAKIPTKVDQKDVLVQETVEKFPKLTPSNSHNSSSASNGEQEFPKEKVQISDSEKLGMSVITLAGENKGAVMDLSPSRNKIHSITNPHTLHNNGNHAKPWSEGEKSSSNEEGKSNKEKKNKKAMAMQSPPSTAYVNSNVQGVNNSILFNGSFTHKNPGVHIAFSRKPNEGHGIHLKDHNAK